MQPFEFTENEHVAIEKWRTDLSELFPDKRLIFTYKFVPTGIGSAVSVEVKIQDKKESNQFIIQEKEFTDYDRW